MWVFLDFINPFLTYKKSLWTKFWRIVILPLCIHLDSLLTLKLEPTMLENFSHGVSVNNWRPHESGQFGLDNVFQSDEEEEGGIDGIPVALARRALSLNTSYPGVMDRDPICWSRWDELRDTNSPCSVRLLFSSAIRWVCRYRIVRVWAPQRRCWTCLVWTKDVSHLQVFCLLRLHPRLAHLHCRGHSLGWCECFVFFIYAELTFADSMTIHHSSSLDAKYWGKPEMRSDFMGAGGITDRFIAIVCLTTQLFWIDAFANVCWFFLKCTTNPASLYVLSSISFTTLHIIPSTSLVTFAHPIYTNNNNVSVSYIDMDEQPCPIYSISYHLLSHAARLDQGTQAEAQSHLLSGTFGVSQADLGNSNDHGRYSP